MTLNLECLILFYSFLNISELKNITYRACNPFVSWIGPPSRWWMLNYKRVSWFSPSTFSFPSSPFPPNSRCSANNRVFSLTATLLSNRFDRKTRSILEGRHSNMPNIGCIRWWWKSTFQLINCDLFNNLVEIVYPKRLVPKDNTWLGRLGVFRIKKNKIISEIV